jgi:MFS family permease
MILHCGNQKARSDSRTYEVFPWLHILEILKFQLHPLHNFLSMLTLTMKSRFGWRSHPTFLLSTVAIGQFTDIFLYSIVLPVLPFLLQHRLHLDPEDVQSQVSRLLACFSAASLFFSIPAGWLADWVSTRRSLYLSGLLVLMLATIIFALAKTFWLLALSRVLQGLSAAIVNATGLAMVVDTVGSRRLGATLGTVCTTYTLNVSSTELQLTRGEQLHSFIAVGELGSPFLGGVLYKVGGYHVVFGVSFAALAIDFLMRALLIETKLLSPDSSHANQLEQAVPGPVDQTESDPLLQDQQPSTPPLHDKPRYLPIFHCVQDHQLLAALLLTFVQAFIIGSYDATLTTEAASLFNFTSLESGVLFLCLGLPNLILAPLAGLAVDRFGAKTVATAGFAFLAPSLALLRLPGYHLLSPEKNVILIYAILGLNGIWLSVTSAPGIVAATHAVEDIVAKNRGLFGPKGPYGQLFGLNWLVFNLGLTIGAIVSGDLRVAIGYGNMYAVVAGTTAFTAIVSFIYL